MKINLRAYAQLVRLPNVFTAWADIALAALATGALVTAAEPAVGRFVLLLLASGCLYCGGMVWNDIFDVEQDRQERPFRPLPSGKVSRAAAIRLGLGLLAGGVLFACLSAWDGEEVRAGPLVVAGLLATAILLYDGWLKRTWAGPLGMGSCRFLNVLLGLSLASEETSPWGIYLGATVGMYITGVTWLARTEARVSNRDALRGAAAVMLAGLLMALPLPMVARDRDAAGTISSVFLYLLVVYGFILGLAVSRAIGNPSPGRVQMAVKRAVLGLVAFDAILATALAGLVGLVILLLLPPALYLGRRLYST